MHETIEMWAVRMARREATKRARSWREYLALYNSELELYLA